MVVMPNHIHGILWLLDGPGTRNMQSPAPRVIPGSLSAIIRSCKSAVTRQINLERNGPGMPVWQNGYLARSIRSTAQLERIREGIRRNPSCWPQDVLYPGDCIPPRVGRDSASAG